MTVQLGRPAVYLCPTEHCPNLLQLAVGLLAELTGHYGAVGVFRPIVAEASADRVLDALVEQAGTGTGAPRWGATADECLENPAGAAAQVVSRFAECASRYDAVLVLGSEYDCSLAPIEFAWNTRISADLHVPLVLVVPGRGGADPTRQRAAVALAEAQRSYAQVVAVLVVRTPGQSLDRTELADLPVPVFVVDDLTPNRADEVGVLDALHASVVAGARDVSGIRAADLLRADTDLASLLPAVRPTSTVVFASDRDEIPLGLLVGAASRKFPLPAAAIAAGPKPLREEVRALWQELAVGTPLLRTEDVLDRVGRRLAGQQAPDRLTGAQLEEARRVFARQVDSAVLLDTSKAVGRADIVTPLMFEHRLLEQARKANQHIVLPEGTEERILRAAHRLLDQRICRLTLLG
ncbi:phosphate acyltransferase, partial [Propioniciclava sp.]|uniref:phosphate acyltransferase n=1 Tax=Propioniciclava sp. TaxID=2038686 RepID=UPI0026201B67